MDQRMLKRMLQEAQKSQKVLQEKLREFDNRIFDSVLGTDHVKISMTGNLEVKTIKIASELLADQETLEELLCDAFNQALSQIQSEREKLEQANMPKTNGLF